MSRDLLSGGPWKLIEGYRYPYRINRGAVVQRQLPSGEWRPLKPHFISKKRDNMGCAMLSMAVYPKGMKKVSVTTLMEGRWLPKRKPGQIFRHKNGSRLDCSAWNMELTTQSELARRLNGPGRRPVEKIDRDGNVLEVYRSVSEAARANFVCNACVHRRCSGKIADPFALTGFSFRYSADK